LLLFHFFSPTLYVGEYEHGSFAICSYVDETSVTIAVSSLCIEIDIDHYTTQYGIKQQHTSSVVSSLDKINQ